MPSNPCNLKQLLFVCEIHLHNLVILKLDQFNDEHHHEHIPFEMTAM